MCLSAVLLAKWYWSVQGSAHCARPAGMEGVNGLSGSSVAAAALGSPGKTTWVEGESKRYNPLFKSHSRLLNAPTSSVSPIVALSCILLLFHLQFLPTYFKNM